MFVIELQNRRIVTGAAKPSVAAVLTSTRRADKGIAETAANEEHIAHGQVRVRVEFSQRIIAFDDHLQPRVLNRVVGPNDRDPITAADAFALANADAQRGWCVGPARDLLVVPTLNVKSVDVIVPCDPPMSIMMPLMPLRVAAEC